LVDWLGEESPPICWLCEHYINPEIPGKKWGCTATQCELFHDNPRIIYFWNKKNFSIYDFCKVFLGKLPFCAICKGNRPTKKILYRCEDAVECDLYPSKEIHIPPPRSEGEPIPENQTEIAPEVEALLINEFGPNYMEKLTEMENWRDQVKALLIKKKPFSLTEAGSKSNEGNRSLFANNTPLPPLPSKPQIEIPSQIREVFLNGDLREEYIWKYPKLLKIDPDLKNQYIERYPNLAIFKNLA
jgi:hypothetical protein